MTVTARPFDLTVEGAPSPADRQALSDNLRSYNRTQNPVSKADPLAVFVRDTARRIWGGLDGYTFGGWLYVTSLWIDESLRGQGLGREVITLGERHAAERGCTDVWLDTFTFQAPDFYRHLGYEVFAELPHAGFTRYFLRKRLRP